ncbi:MAG: LytTR family DNA-binding domain-containing protein [Ferruginibacter sp.]
MYKTLTTKFSATDKKAAILCVSFVLTLVALTVTQDIVRSELKNSTFYFSESFMFSSFWWLFAPLFFLQYLFVRNRNKTPQLFKIALLIFPIIVHLFSFPLLVWLLSKIFYYHTYSIKQTLHYTVSEYLYVLIAAYTLPLLAFLYFKGKKTPELMPGSQNEDISNQFIKFILISEGYKKFSIAVSEIYYFSANPPYINIHVESQKYLQNETLKSVSLKLNPRQFIRVHKSAIVNIQMVTSYKTRLNGDYDLMLNNNAQLRVSRNFAADFKSLFKESQQLATK